MQTLPLQYTNTIKYLDHVPNNSSPPNSELEALVIRENQIF